MAAESSRLLAAFRHPLQVWENVRWRLTWRTSSESHVFVLGAPRSGTTLMQIVLAAHPRLCSLQSETGLFTWQTLLDPTPRTVNLTPAQRAECRDVVEFMDRIAAEEKRRTEADRFIEKTPQHVRWLGYIQRRFPNAQFVHLVRDGRDCYCSGREVDLPRSQRLTTFARYWRRCVRARHEQGDDARVIDVHYEALTGEPEREVRRVMRFLGVPFAPAQIDPEARVQDRRSGADKFPRLSHKITPHSQGRWKDELSMQEQRAFGAIAGDELEALGYPLRRRHA